MVNVAEYPDYLNELNKLHQYMYMESCVKEVKKKLCKVPGLTIIVDYIARYCQGERGTKAYKKLKCYYEDLKKTKELAEEVLEPLKEKRKEAYDTCKDLAMKYKMYGNFLNTYEDWCIELSIKG